MLDGLPSLAEPTHGVERQSARAGPTVNRVRRIYKALLFVCVTIGVIQVRGEERPSAHVEQGDAVTTFEDWLKRSETSMDPDHPRATTLRRTLRMMDAEKFYDRREGIGDYLKSVLA